MEKKSFKVRRPNGEFYRIGGIESLQQLQTAVLNKKEFGLNGKQSHELLFKEEDGTNVNDDAALNSLDDATKLYVLLPREKIEAPTTEKKGRKNITICSKGDDNVKIVVPKKSLQKSPTLQQILEDADDAEWFSICEVSQYCLNVVKHYLMGSYSLERIAELSKTNKEIEEMFRYLDISLKDVNRLEVKIDEMIKEFQSSRISEISISKISTKNWGEFIAQFNVKEKNVKLEKSPPPHPKSSDGHELRYEWDLDKTEAKQMGEVMAWFTSVLDLPPDSLLKPIDLSANKNLFVMPSNLQVKLKGTTDIGFIDEATANLGANYGAGIKICVEVKKQVTPSHILQAKGELFACDAISYYQPLVFLTDLHKNWMLFFFESSNLVISRISFQTAIDTIKAMCVTKIKKGTLKFDISKEVKPTRFFDPNKFLKGAPDVADLVSLLDSLPEEDQIEVRQELFWKGALATPSLAALSYYS